MPEQVPFRNSPTLVVMVTGHPATGKTTLAHHLARELGLPLLWRDRIKETLLNMLPPPDAEVTAWSRRLGVVSWTLLYQQIEVLLQAGIAHVVESNFDPAYADANWQCLTRTYSLRLVQIRCETAPETLLARYRARIATGERHVGHVDDSDNPAFLATIRRGPMDWVSASGMRIAVNTTELDLAGYDEVAREVAALIHLQQ